MGLVGESCDVALGERGYSHSLRRTSLTTLQTLLPFSTSFHLDIGSHL